MGRVRSALRAYALESRDPGEVLRRLDLKLQHFEAGEMVTVLYAVVEPPFDEVLVSCAGHVPPVLHPGAGAVARLVDVAVDPPLGVRPSGGRRTTAVPFPPGALLCLYTDGLVEHRGELIDDGIDRLRDALGAGPPEAACAEVMARLVGTATVEDDVALLIVQRSPSAGEQRPLELHLEAHPASLARFRSAARPWLARTGASAEAVEEVLLAVGEAASNAVEHAYGPDGGAVTVQLERDGHSIVATVQDRGRWRTSRAAGRGRGLLIMERWSDELRIERGAQGTTVVLRRSVGPGDVG
jgi:anti-sigma regulatory factor (Ser/Thr protein kinase)